MVSDITTCTTDFACDGQQEQLQPIRCAAPGSNVLRGPPGCFLKPPTRKNMDEVALDSNASEQESEPRSKTASGALPLGVFKHSHFALGDVHCEASVFEDPLHYTKPLVAPPPGVFTQSRAASDGLGFEEQISERRKKPNAVKTALLPPPGVFTRAHPTQGPLSRIQLYQATPSTEAFTSASSDVARHGQEQRRWHSVHQQHLEKREKRSACGPPPGLFVTAKDCDSHSAKGKTKRTQHCTPSEKAIKIPLDFRPPPGLEHLVDLTCHRQVTCGDKQAELSLHSSESCTDPFDLSTIASSNSCSSSDELTDEVDQITSDNESDQAERTGPQDDAAAKGQVELHLDELVRFKKAAVDHTTPSGNANAAVLAWREGMHAASVLSAWHQWYADAEALDWKAPQ